MIDIDGLLLRMQSTTGAMDFRHLASILGVTERNIRLWKQIGEVPIKILVVIAEDRDVSLDWLVFGLAGERETRGRTAEEAMAPVRKLSPAQTQEMAQSLRTIADSLSPGSRRTGIEHPLMEEAVKIANEQRGKGGDYVYVPGHGNVYVPMKRGL